MELQNLFSEPSLTKSIEHRCITREHTIFPQCEPILTEHALQARVNHSLTLDFVCLPQFLPELILGHLVTEGYLHEADEVTSLTIHADGHSAEVSLSALAAPTPLPMVTPIDWDAEWVFALADRFAQGMPIHEKTFATHSCFLAQGTQLLFQCEDIGRHNAVDKAIGFALMHGIDLHSCLLYSSGRMPIDMVQKAIRAEIPVLAGKGSPTAGAVALAQQHGLTLLCAARRDRMKLFAGAAPQSCTALPVSHSDIGQVHGA